MANLATWGFPVSEKEKWFTAMLAIIIILLGALGTLNLLLNTQTWGKLDRITALFIHERDLINSNIAKVCDKQNDLAERVGKIEERTNNKK